MRLSFFGLTVRCVALSAILLMSSAALADSGSLAWQQGAAPKPHRTTVSQPVPPRPVPSVPIKTPAAPPRIAKQPTAPSAVLPPVQQGQVVYATNQQASRAGSAQAGGKLERVMQAACNCEQPPAPMAADPYGDALCEGPSCACGDPMCCDASCGVPACGLGGCGDGVACGDACCGPNGCCGACGCGPGEECIGSCAERGAIPLVLYLPPIKELTLFGGVHGFKGPLDYRPNPKDAGNFGFHEGVNIGGKMAWLPFPYLGYQVGYQATHSQLDGDSIRNTTGMETQHFLTAGLFHRRRVGLQYGAVWDYLRDDRQGNGVSFGQVRGLVGVTNPMGREVGFTFALNSDDQLIGATNFQATDQYLFYYGIHGRYGGEARLFGGFTDDSDGVLGLDIMAPLSNCWSIQTGFTYLMPSSETGVESATEEQWNIGINLVWHFGGRAKACQTSPFRPLFNVADNSSMMIDDR